MFLYSQAKTQNPEESTQKTGEKQINTNHLGINWKMLKYFRFNQADYINQLYLTKTQNEFAERDRRGWVNEPDMEEFRNIIHLEVEINGVDESTICVNM